MRKVLTKILIMLFSIFFIYLSASSYKVNAENNQTRVIAHRGLAHGAPENTVDAIIDAARDKIEFAELDVQESRDGEVVLMHDRNLKRLTGVNKKVSEMDYSQLSRLYLKGERGKNNQKERIPTLEMVIKKAKERIRLDIEIKPYGKERDLTEKVVGLIEKNRIEKQCIITSFDYDVLVYAKQLNPKIRTSLILKSRVKDVLLKNVDIFSVERHFVTAQLVKNIHINNKKIHVWTVNNVNDMMRFKTLGVDYIITDNIDGFKNMNNENVTIEQKVFIGIEKIIELIHKEEMMQRI